MTTMKPPATPASKIDKTPVSTPSSRMDRTPASTPGGPRAKEEKIVVTVRLRPLSKREQAAKDQVAWECIDDQTIVYKPPISDRSTQPSSFTFGIHILSFTDVQFEELNVLVLPYIMWLMLKLCCFLCSDKVFGPSCSTEMVYEEGVKNVALSALMGINGNIHENLFVEIYHYVCYFMLSQNVC